MAPKHDGEYFFYFIRILLKSLIRPPGGHYNLKTKTPRTSSCLMTLRAATCYNNLARLSLIGLERIEAAAADGVKGIYSQGREKEKAAEDNYT